MAKRLQHLLKLHVGHEPQLLVLLPVEFSEPGHLHGLALVQACQHVIHQGLHSLQCLPVRKAMLRHQFVGHHAVVGGQSGIEEHVSGRGDDLAFGLVVPSGTRVADKSAKSRKHHTVVVPKHARQNLQHIFRCQTGSVTK